MKKLLTALFLIWAFCSNAQTIRTNPLPNFQQLGSSATLTRVNGVLYPVVGFAPSLYTDTTAANSGSIKGIPFVQISTSSDGKNWYRSVDTLKWQEIGSGWGLSGNQVQTNQFIGATNNRSFVFKTNNQTRAILDSTGRFFFPDSARPTLNMITLNSKTSPFNTINNTFRYTQGTNQNPLFQINSQYDSTNQVANRLWPVEIGRYLAMKNGYPSAFEATGALRALNGFETIKGNYQMFVDYINGFPMGTIVSANRFRKLSGDSVVRYTFYGSGSGLRAAYPNFGSRTDFSWGASTADVYGMTAGFLSYMVGSGASAAGRRIQSFSHFAAGTNIPSGGIYEAIHGLYIEPMKGDSVIRAWGILQLGVNDRNAFRGKVNIGDSTLSGRDSTLNVVGSIYGTGGLRLSGLPDNNPSVTTPFSLYVDGNGTVFKDSVASTAVLTYTPTLTNTTNIDSSTAFTTYYKVEGEWVHVWGEVELNPTAGSTLTVLEMSIPTGATFSASRELAGTAATEDNSVAQIKGSTSNARAIFRLNPNHVNMATYSFTFSYKIVNP